MYIYICIFKIKNNSKTKKNNNSTESKNSSTNDFDNIISKKE